jgi:hypothetical protein
MIPIRQEPEQKSVQAPAEGELSADLVSLQRLKALLAELELQLRMNDGDSDKK